jgi:hypothetical protein
MKKVIKLKESQLLDLIKKKINEQRDTENYMFFSNLKQIARHAEELLNLPTEVVEEMLQNGHDWADDHISKSKENLDHVYEFMMNVTQDHEEGFEEMDDVTMTEGRKKTGTKLCARGKAAAKARFDVYPSAYSNGHAVQVCKGKIKGLDGKKRCSGSYC